MRVTLCLADLNKKLNGTYRKKLEKAHNASLTEIFCDRCRPSSYTFNTPCLLFILFSLMIPNKPTLQQQPNQWRRCYCTFEELEEDVTKQLANSSKNEYVKLSFEEVTTCFDLLDTSQPT